MAIINQDSYLNPEDRVRKSPAKMNELFFLNSNPLEISFIANARKNRNGALDKDIKLVLNKIGQKAKNRVAKKLLFH